MANLDDISSSGFGTGRRADPRFQKPVNGLGTVLLQERLRRGLKAAQDEFPPNTGMFLMAFDFGGGGGLGHISNAERADMIEAIKEWLRHQGEKV